MIDKRKWLWIAVALVVVVSGVSVMVVKSRHGANASEKARASVEIEAVSSKTVEGIQILSSPIDINDPGLFPANGYLDLQKEMAGVKPAVEEYSVDSDLSNVANAKLFKSLLQAEDRKLLAQNCFVAVPSDYDQMFYVYENNEYQRPERIPSFITTDSMLHTYHVFYDYSLRTVETGPLFDALVKLTEGMLRASQNDYNNAIEGSVKEAAKRNIAYFSVARQLLKDTPPPDIAVGMAKADLASIAKHAGRGECKCVGISIDFSQFIPRGHYTRSDKLRRYFKAMMWYGLTAFMAEKSPEFESRNLESLMMVRDLRTVKYQGKVLYDYWNTIYEPTVFYVGKADDYSVYDYAGISDRVFGKSASVDSFVDEAKAAALRSEIAKLPKPKIKGFPPGKQYRFMGQRYIPDSRVTQEIGDKLWPEYPAALDVFAAMGSDQALKIRQESGIDNIEAYNSTLTQMRIELEHTPLHTWQSNLYWGWLWSLKSVIEPAPEGYPSFMRNQAWVDKSLFTALGSWTELRHDTILYAKQSVAECGGSEEEEEIAQPKGYVEPNLEFWVKLKWLNDYTRQGLEQRGLLNEELRDKFEKVGDLIEFCRRVSVKELTNQKLTHEEYEQISMYGPQLEKITLSFADGSILSDTDKDMAVVADVHTNADTCLEEGTGRAAAIYVVVPIEGKLYLTRGSVFTHYEFTWPASDRLTDEKWQKMLRGGSEPAFAPWTKSFLVPERRRLEEQFFTGDGGC